MRAPWLLALLLVGGCAASESALVRRAAFDLDCPEADLHVVDLDGDVRGVKGCGRQATYVSRCNGQPGYIGTTCSWMMDNRDPSE